MKKEKNYLMYGIILILLILVGVLLMYIVTEKEEGDKQTNGDLSIVFNEDENINGTDIEPGWSTIKTFSVENKTNSSYDYNIAIEDLVNTFSTTNYLVYKITGTDGGYDMTDYADVPKSSTAKDVVLANNVTIPSKSTHNYTIEIKTNDSFYINQNKYVGKELSGKISIKEEIVKKRITATDFKTAILEDNPIVSERTDFSEINADNTTGTIYKTNNTEDDSVVYYYSGNTTNNWVKFGIYSNNGPVIGYYSSTIDGYLLYDTLEECNAASSYNYNCHYLYQTGDDMYWRIIRTNEDGSVRLLYAGIGHDTEKGYIGLSSYNEDNYDSRHVGYMYGGNTNLEDNRSNTTSSTIKTYIDNWYQSNLLNNYDKYISKTAIYCNDRSVGSGRWSSKNGSDYFYYGSATKLFTNKTPTYKCGGLYESKQATADKFSASTVGGGNGQLTYGVALMTSDELVFAGAKKSTSLPAPYSYYYTNSLGNSITGSTWWWLMSPFYWYGGGSDMFSVIGSDGGDLNSSSVDSDSTISVRPVLSLSSCAKVTGIGTPTDPYVIDEINSVC